MEKTAGKILLQHLDTTKFYRVKSGLFGSRDTISLRKEYNNKKNKVKNNELTSSKSNLMMTLSRNNFLQSEKLDFISHPERYEYTYDGAVFLATNEFAYVIKFKPKKSKANFKGKLYISETDYAVLRADYTLGEGKTEGGFNMKLLLGIKASENVSKGTLIFKQNQDGKGYYLQYASNETGQYIYINRPLKFIELSDEEKDVVAFDLTVEGNTSRKTELLNISRNAISETTFENVKEENFKYIPLKRYDPAIWKNLSAIEPLEEMKAFKAVD
jgi:outer membrane lipoprotein-sorting protein